MAQGQDPNLLISKEQMTSILRGYLDKHSDATVETISTNFSNPQLQDLVRTCFNELRQHDASARKVA
jgi:hypothetical protein